MRFDCGDRAKESKSELYQVVFVWWMRSGRRILWRSNASAVTASSRGYWSSWSRGSKRGRRCQKIRVRLLISHPSSVYYLLPHRASKKNWKSGVHRRSYRKTSMCLLWTACSIQSTFR